MAQASYYGGPGRAAKRVFQRKLIKYYSAFLIGLLLFILLMGGLEIGVSLERRVIGWMFLLMTLMLYAVIGVLNFTKRLDEYYVAGRKVPAFFNGMATGADWMSAASFISMAGSIWLLGYDGLAYVMGWTGGYVLVSVLVRPHLRKVGPYTVPDFFAFP